MATKSEITSHLQTVDGSSAVAAQGRSIFDMLEGQRDQFVAAMNNEAGARRLTRILMTEIRKNPKLGECSPASLMGAAMMCAQVNLEPGHLGQVYLIPRKNNRAGVTEVNWQLGYKGMIELALRTGKVSSMMAKAVHDNDHFVHVDGFEPRFVHEIDYRNPRGDAFVYYSYARMADGVPAEPMVLTMDEIYEARELSDGYRYAESGPSNKGGSKKDSVWHKFESAMAKKTAVRRHWNWLPKSYEMVDAYSADESVITVDDPERVRAEELTVTREDLMGEVAPELDAGKPVVIHPAPKDEPEFVEQPAIEATASEATPWTVDDLIDLAKEHGKIGKTTKPSTATKAMLTIASDAVGATVAVLEDAIGTHGQVIADHIKAPAVEEA